MEQKTLLLDVDYTNGVGVNGKGEFWADSYIKNKEVRQKKGETLHETICRAMREIDCADPCFKGQPQANQYQGANEKKRVTGYVYRVKHYIESRS